MHIAAAKQKLYQLNWLIQKKLARETEILKEQARGSGKQKALLIK